MADSLAEDDDLEEIFDADLDRVDAVKGPASGIPILMLKALGEQPALGELMQAIGKDTSREGAQDTDRAFNEQMVDSPEVQADMTADKHAPIGDVAKVAGDAELGDHPAYGSGSAPVPEEHAEEGEDADEVWEALDVDTEDSGGSDEPTSLQKRKLTTADRKKMPRSQFAYVDENGEGHYPINDANHVRNALSRAAQQIKRGGKGAALARKALPKIRAAAKRMGIGQEGDKEDTEKVLSQNDLIAIQRAAGHPEHEGGPSRPADLTRLGKAAPRPPRGDAATPGSPAWEKVDATQAAQAVETLLSLRDALCALEDRESAEVQEGMDSDTKHVWALHDAQQALDCVLGIVASFQAEEQHEAVGVSKQSRSRVVRQTHRLLEAIRMADDPTPIDKAKRDAGDADAEAEDGADDGDNTEKAAPTHPFDGSHRHEHGDMHGGRHAHEHDHDNDGDHAHAHERADMEKAAATHPYDGAHSHEHADGDGGRHTHKHSHSDDGDHAHSHEDVAGADTDRDDSDVEKSTDTQLANLIAAAVTKGVEERLSPLQDVLKRLDAVQPNRLLTGGQATVQTDPGPDADWFLAKTPRPQVVPGLEGVTDQASLEKALDKVDPLVAEQIRNHLATGAIRR
ncbi:MAG: hypothetical protein ACRDL8_00620, partial [Solirubrobacteraceae bacterium]